MKPPSLNAKSVLHSHKIMGWRDEEVRVVSSPFFRGVPQSHSPHVAVDDCALLVSPPFVNLTFVFEPVFGIVVKVQCKLFEGKSPKGEGSFDTREVRNALGSDIPFNEPSVAAWLKEALDEEINSIFGGVLI